MITNDRQYRIAKAELKKFNAAIDSYSVDSHIKSGLPQPFAEAGLDQLKSEAAILQEEIHEYETLLQGEERDFSAVSLTELPLLLIKARIAKGWTQKDLGEALGMKEQQIQRYEATNYASCKLQTLNRIADALQLEIVEDAHIEGDEAPNSLGPNDSQAFPIAEMYKRGWFSNFSGTLSEARRNASSLLGTFFAQAGWQSAQPAMLRQRIRADGVFHSHSLTAWHARVLILAKNQLLPRNFDRNNLTNDWFAGLRALSRHPSGPLLAKAWLLQTGIHFVFEPHLPSTHLDGAALHGRSGNPIVALTLRHDRIDHFWFVLFHELSHIKLHFHVDDTSDFFDNLDANDGDIELEADHYALNKLIPDALWETSLARFAMDPEIVREEAAQFEVHPAILAGRIRHDTGRFDLLSEQVGQGEVRRMFKTYDLSDLEDLLI